MRSGTKHLNHPPQFAERTMDRLAESIELPAIFDTQLLGCASLARFAMSRTISLLFRKHVRKHKSIALDHFTPAHCNRAREHGCVINERVKLPIFTAWVDFG